MPRRKIQHKKTHRLPPTVLAERRSWWEERLFRFKPFTEVGKENKQGRHSDTELYCGEPARLSNPSFDAASSSVPHTVSSTKKVLSQSVQPFLNFKFVGSLHWCVAPTTFSSQLILSMGTSVVSRNLQEAGVVASEGEGTWAMWMKTDPLRLQELYRGAVTRLQHRYLDLLIDPSDSTDGAETANLRYLAHKKKVFCGFVAWRGYDSYRLDFEGDASVFDPIIGKLRGNLEQTADEETKDTKRLCSQRMWFFPATISQKLQMPNSLSIALRRCWELYFLVSKDVAKFTRASKQFHQGSNLVAQMRLWLQKHENGRYFFGASQSIHRHYDACRLQRGYLRFLQHLDTPSVVAGSYALMHHEGRHGGCSWMANDIDIWVFSEDDLLSYKDSYNELVLQPLRLQEDVCDCYFYNDDADSDAVREVDKDSDQMELSPRHPPQNAVLLKTAINEWCDSCTRIYPDLMDGHLDDPTDIAQIASLVESLKQTVHHLPLRFENRQYRVIRSIKVKPVSRRPMPSSSLLTINIIQVQCAERTLSNFNYPSPSVEIRNAAFICGGFDLTCCCVALLINEDHTFQILTFEEADVALRSKTLHLRATAFASGASSEAIVSIGMRRIKKYMTRSFSWP